ncbi:MAG: DUF2577 family protein [Defluviitaleaceae bacterium]|nr:DUF2577 family protein [Defluviitaleaceae bacterium]
MNYFQKYAKEQQEYAEKCAAKYDSHIIFGTVRNVDPLEIEMQSGDILPSKFFYLTDNVIVKKVRLIVHRMYGRPEIVTFQGQADDVSDGLAAAFYNRMASASDFNLQFFAPEGTSGGSVVSPPGSYGISGDEFSRWLTMKDGGIILDMPALTASEVFSELRKTTTMSGDVAFRIEFTEAAGNTPEPDKPQQNQTTAIEGIIWQGLKAGDICLMTSHNHGQKHLVHRILNRSRDQYEHGIVWDSRLTDIGDHVSRH